MPGEGDVVGPPHAAGMASDASASARKNVFHIGPGVTWGGKRKELRGSGSPLHARMLRQLNGVPQAQRNVVGDQDGRTNERRSDRSDSAPMVAEACRSIRHDMRTVQVFRVI